MESAMATAPGSAGRGAGRSTAGIDAAISGPSSFDAASRIDSDDVDATNRAGGAAIRPWRGAGAAHPIDAANAIVPKMMGPTVCITLPMVCEAAQATIHNPLRPQQL